MTTILLVLNSDITRSAPGPSLGKSFERDYKRGDQIMISYYNWPGKPYPDGTIGSQMNPDGHEKWSFWTNSDIDCALIFSADRVGKIIAPDDDCHRKIFNDAPFTVEFWPCDYCQSRDNLRLVGFGGRLHYACAVCTAREAAKLKTR